MSTHDSAKDTPRHPTSVAPGEAAGDGLDEPLEEGLGERLEWIVDIHANRIAGRADVGRWWDGLSDYARRKHLGCAVRELDGQRHALREERKALLSSWWRAMEAAGIQVHESLPDAVRGMRDERDAALAEVERERDRLDDCARRGLSVCRDIDDARSERDAAIERAEKAERRLRDTERGFDGCPVHASICGDQQRLAVRRINELEVARGAAEARVRELESDAELAVSIHRATLGSEMCGLVDGAHVVWQHVQSLRTQLEDERARVRDMEAEVRGLVGCDCTADIPWHDSDCPLAPQPDEDHEPPIDEQVAASLDGAGRHAYDGPEPFDAWHARECPLFSSGRRGCVEPDVGFSEHPNEWGRFAGRSCREVYAAEVLGRGGEEGALKC